MRSQHETQKVQYNNFDHYSFMSGQHESFLLFWWEVISLRRLNILTLFIPSNYMYHSLFKPSNYRGIIP